MSSNTTLCVINLNLTQISYLLYSVAGNNAFKPLRIINIKRLAIVALCYLNMPKTPNFFVKIATFCLIVLLMGWGMSDPALATTQQLQFQTADGHKIKTTFNYDATQSQGLVREHGKGKTKTVESLQIDFYQASGELIAHYDNIVNGVSTGNYFEFSFDPATSQLSGSLDLGGESPGEMYLKGESDRDLWLIKVDQSGQEQAIAKVTKYAFGKE